MRSRHVLLKHFFNEALLELVFILFLGTSTLAVCPSICSCSHSHREVDCSWRGLRQLPDGLQHNLRSLNLSHNRFHNLDGELTSYTHLRVLDLSYNRLNKLPKDLPRSLWQLYATFNRIQLLDKNDTVYQWNLRILDLSYNKLERAIFINNTLISLSKLNLSNNHLQTVPTNLPSYLETIDLSLNMLIRVLPGSLDRLTRLTHFYLHSNRFSMLPSGVLDNLISLRVIDLDNNPWACHLYADITYLVSWTQRTPAHILGCPCNTHPVCGGVRRSRTGGWHFASYNLPPLAASAQDLTSTPPEGGVTGWWYFPSSSLLSTTHTTKESQELSFTSRPISFSTQRPRTHLTINHLSGTANPTDADHLWHTDSHLISATKETSPSETSSYSDASLITETSKVDEVALATDRFFTTQGPSTQTKKTTTRTRSVRRNNQNLPGGISSSSSQRNFTACFLFLLFHNILCLIFPQILR